MRKSKFSIFLIKIRMLSKMPISALQIFYIKKNIGYSIQIFKSIIELLLTTSTFALISPLVERNYIMTRHDLLTWKFGYFWVIKNTLPPTNLIVFVMLKQTFLLGQTTNFCNGKNDLISQNKKKTCIRNGSMWLALYKLYSIWPIWYSWP